MTRARRPAISEVTIRELHRRMFDQTWTWAGQFRTTDKNIGAHWPTISTEVRNLVDDAHYWMEHETFAPAEAAARLHHRLVKVHPFPNGNGRHARLWCDMILEQMDRPPLDWHRSDLDSDTSARRAYIDAPRAADREDLGPLLALLLP
jgi:Fic-DOC domain mobile mystery protein B